MASYLDENGLLYFWQKIKNKFARISDIPTGSSTPPVMDGIASIGSETAWAHGDHVHPTDTTRAPIDSPVLTGTPKAPTAVNGTNNTQIATTAFVKNAIDTASTIDTTYTLSQDPNDGHDVILTSSSGGVQTITIPDNDTKDLSQMTGTLPVVLGGTGTTSLSGLLKGNGPSSPISSAGASDVTSVLGNTPVNRATADASGNNISDTYAKKSDIAGIYAYRGSVATESMLPITGRQTGDVYNIESASSYGAPGANVAWNGTAWDSLGEIFTIGSITNSDIDDILDT